MSTTSVAEQFALLFKDSLSIPAARSDQNHPKIHTRSTRVKIVAMEVTQVSRQPRINSPSRKENDSAQAESMPTTKQQIQIRLSDSHQTVVTRLPTSNALGYTFRGAFCPLELVRRLPYKYLDGSQDDKNEIAHRFFANDKFYERPWDLCYVYPPTDLSARPILLLPWEQVMHFFDLLNTTYDIDLATPGFPFTWLFYNDQTPQPIFIRQACSRVEVEDIKIALSSQPAPQNSGKCPANASREVETSFEIFYNNCRVILEAHKPSKKDKGTSKRNAAEIRQQNNGLALRRVQQYLGLRPSEPVPETGEMQDAYLTWDEEQRVRDQIAEQNTVLPPLNPATYVASQFLETPLMVCIDVEVFECDHKIITEIGISTLDTRHLQNVVLGEKGSHWNTYIVSQHLRIKGTEALVNKKFCPGNPDGFRFGISRFVSLAEAADCVDSYFDGRRSNSQDKQPVILIGHNISADIGFLQTLGTRTFAAGQTRFTSNTSTKGQIPNLTTYDTGLLFQTLNDEPHPKSLGAILQAFDIEAYQLHNAGNDARYTLEAFIRITLEARIRDTGKRAYDDVEGLPKW